MSESKANYAQIAFDVSQASHGTAKWLQKRIDTLEGELADLKQALQFEIAHNE